MHKQSRLRSGTPTCNICVFVTAGLLRFSCSLLSGNDAFKTLCDPHGLVPDESIRPFPLGAASAAKCL